jgi:hypothetical protein
MCGRVLPAADEVQRAKAAAGHAVLVDQPVEDRLTVCRCLRGASRSARRISSITGLNGSSFDPGGGLFRGRGQAEASALTTVRRPTLYLRSMARPDNPARASRRIAA